MIDKLFRYNVNGNEPRLDPGSNPLLMERGLDCCVSEGEMYRNKLGDCDSLWLTERPYTNDMVEDYRIACCPISLLWFQLVFIIIHIYYPLTSFLNISMTTAVVQKCLLAAKQWTQSYSALGWFLQYKLMCKPSNCTHYFYVDFYPVIVKDQTVHTLISSLPLVWFHFSKMFFVSC